MPRHRLTTLAGIWKVTISKPGKLKALTMTAARPRAAATTSRNIDGILKPADGSNSSESSRRFHFSVALSTKQAVMSILAILAVLAVVSGLLYMICGKLSRNSALISPDGSQSSATGDSLQAVQAAINRHYVLPSNEVPALATITDKTKLTAGFRDNARNGDRLLIYQKNHQAVLYRPSIDRVIAIAPVTIDNPRAQ